MNQKPNLLIVDDIQVNLFLIESLLRKTDVNLIKATSGFEALEKASGVDLALAVLDVRMPGMDGYELAKRLNENRHEDKVPVIFLTANYMSETEIFEGYDSGAVDYLIKPINNQILISKVNVFLDLFRQKQIVRENARLLKESAEELARVNGALKESEEKYRSYIDYAPDGVIVADETGRFLEVNQATTTITGYPQNELLGMSFSDILHKKSLKEKTGFFRDTEQQNPAKSELLFKHKNGSNLWLSIESVKLSEKQYLCFTQDITARKRAEQELHCSLKQLQQLTQHIEEVRENERVVIARELHDDLGQALTAVKIDLGIIKQKITDQDVIVKIDKVSELVRDTIFTVQRLTSELRPQIIDDLGLEAAIEWYSYDFAERNQLDVYHLQLRLSYSVLCRNRLPTFRGMPKPAE
jgi:PAS domain S-box-containing protein